MSQFTELDAKVLCARPEFRKFLSRVANLAGIFPPADGADPYLIAKRDGRRSLGLEIIREAARGLPRGTSIEQMLLLSLSETHPQETPDATDAQPESDELQR